MGMCLPKILLDIGFVISIISILNTDAEVNRPHNTVTDAEFETSVY